MTSIPLVSIALTPSSVNVLRETTVRPPGQNAVTPEPTCTLTANQSTAHAGQTVTLTWSSTNATNGGFSHGTGSDGTSGSKTLPTYPPETYYYTAYGPGGQAACSTQVSVM